MIASHPLLGSARRLASKNHTSIGLQSIVIGPAALDSLKGCVAGMASQGRILILRDSSAITIGSEGLCQHIRQELDTIGTLIEHVVDGPNGTVHADAATLALASAAAQGADCIVSIGSGTLTDIGKVAAETSGAKLIAVQTAASVNGFADDMAVVLHDGVKRTESSTWPHSLIADTRVLAGAPSDLTSSGFAEMMAMFTAPADWYLACWAGHDDSFDPAIVELFRQSDEALLNSGAALRANDYRALELLTEVLTAGGLAMGAVRRTAPLSGMEHLISHLLDMSASIDNRLTGLHGAQVGVGALIAACLWERMLDEFHPDDLALPAPAPEKCRSLIDIRFGPLDPSGAVAEECWSDYSEKLTTWTGTSIGGPGLEDAWAVAQSDLRSLVASPETIADALHSAGAPTRFSELDTPIDPDRARWALSSCHLMRKRFSIADLAFYTGRWTDDDVEATLARANEVGGGL